METLLTPQSQLQTQQTIKKSSNVSTVKNVLPTPEKKAENKIFGPPYLGLKSGRNPRLKSLFPTIKQSTSGHSHRY